jgi:hypothetical protein
MKSAAGEIIVCSLGIAAHEAPWMLSIIRWKVVKQDEPSARPDEMATIVPFWLRSGRFSAFQ